MNFFARNPHVAIFSVLLLITLLAATALFAQDGNDGERLVREYRCYACHDMTRTLIGPPYQAIAARHGSNKAVMTAVLARKILLGGGGNWGMVPMVPNEHVPETDATRLAAWILNQAP